MAMIKEIKQAVKYLLRNSYLSNYYFRNHSRSEGTRMEIRFWEKWIENKGGQYKEDFKKRISSRKEVEWPHSEIIRLLNLPSVSILDVGSGPITRMGYVLQGAKFTITACDPNAGIYNEILRKNNIVPPIESVFAEGEKLSEIFSGPFDYITSTNALDHSENPNACIHEMIKLISSNGAIYLQHRINEGAYEAYRGYHKWNISKTDDDSFVIWNPHEEYKYKSTVLGYKITAKEKGETVYIVISNNTKILDWAANAM
jgi:2-polyprenyl-3-methyl-5-hydroxy-6-metoxy-1,4-benzoquinol methylase